MDYSKFRRTLDLQKQGIQFEINVKKNDTSTRELILSIYDGGNAFDLTGVTAVLYGHKPDGTILANDCTVEDVVSSVLTTQTLSVVGECVMQLKLYGTAGGVNQLISAPKFVINVEDVLEDDEAIESTDEFTALTEATIRASQATESANNAASSATTAGGYATSAALQILADKEAGLFNGVDGKDGVDGHSASVTIVKTNTLPAGSDASVTKGSLFPWIANLTFNIPRGDKGETGEQGPRGAEGPVGPQGPKGDRGNKILNIPTTTANILDYIDEIGIYEWGDQNQCRYYTWGDNTTQFEAEGIIIVTKYPEPTECYVLSEYKGWFLQYGKVDEGEDVISKVDIAFIYNDEASDDFTYSSNKIEERISESGGDVSGKEDKSNKTSVLFDEEGEFIADEEHYPNTAYMQEYSDLIFQAFAGVSLNNLDEDGKRVIENFAKDLIDDNTDSKTNVWSADKSKRFYDVLDQFKMDLNLNGLTNQGENKIKDIITNDGFVKKADTVTISDTYYRFTLKDNAEYCGENIRRLYLTYPTERFESYLNFTIAETGTISIEIPHSRYIGEIPTFENGKEYEVSIKNGVVIIVEVSNE